MAESITKYNDTIDSRQVIERIEELTAERDDLESQIGLDMETADDAEVSNAQIAVAQKALADWDASEDGQELIALRALATEAEGYAADWQYGETLIRDSYFKTYAQELAEECDMIPRDLKWPCTCIDWDQAARELQTDYTAVEFCGITYWIR